jgi:hypothetical protein
VALPKQGRCRAHADGRWREYWTVLGMARKVGIAAEAMHVVAEGG